MSTCPWKCAQKKWRCVRPHLNFSRYGRNTDTPFSILFNREIFSYMSAILGMLLVGFILRLKYYENHATFNEAIPPTYLYSASLALYLTLGKIYKNNFQEHDFLWDLKIPPFFPCHVAAEKRAGISSHVKKHVLENCSNIFFTLSNIIVLVKYIFKSRPRFKASWREYALYLLKLEHTR